jgi:hypothetical protein
MEYKSFMIDGKLYESWVVSNGVCDGCAGYVDYNICNKLPQCRDDEDGTDLIFVESTPTKDQVVIGDDLYNVDEYTSCSTCALRDDERCDSVGCVPIDRLDGRDVQFSKVERTPEPHVSSPDTYYRDQLDAIGDLLGIAAYTCDDGTIVDRPLSAKLPELVTKLVYDNAVMKRRIRGLELQ